MLFAELSKLKEQSNRNKKPRYYFFLNLILILLIKQKYFIDYILDRVFRFVLASEQINLRMKMKAYCIVTGILLSNICYDCLFVF